MCQVSRGGRSSADDGEGLPGHAAAPVSPQADAAQGCGTVGGRMQLRARLGGSAAGARTLLPQAKLGLGGGVAGTFTRGAV